jgi:hypothetical protein
MKDYNNPSMLYLHKALHGDKSILEMFTAELPSDVFAESTSSQNNRPSNDRSQGRKPGSGKGKRKTNNVAGAGLIPDSVSKTINSRNNSIAFKNLTDAHASLNEQFKASEKEHNDTYASILNHVGDKNTTNKRIKAVKEKVAKENSLHVYGYESDCDDDNEGADSQEDQIKHLLRCRVRMDDAKEMLENVASKLGARTA